MNLLKFYQNIAEFAYSGGYDEKLFSRIAHKYNLTKKITIDELTIPPLIYSFNDKKISKYYLSVSRGQNLYRLYAKNSENDGLGGTYWVYEIHLRNELPYFIVDSIFNTVGIDMIFKDFQEVDLEGDFSEYFKLYIPTNEQVDVLSVIGPDVMEKLYLYWNEVDLIVAGKKAWLITRNGWSADKSIELILEAGNLIAQELTHRAKSYQS